jgi:hypothetical protein
MGALKSIWAVVAGFLTVIILSVLTDVILETLGVFPPADQGLFVTWMLLLALIYRTGYNVVGGYITARLAPQNPTKHVWVLAILGLVGGIMGIIINLQMNLGPNWYPVLLALFAIPSVLAGGKLYKK